MQKIIFLFLVLLAITPVAHAQQKPMKTLPLEDLSPFKPQAGNWQIVGDVTMDPSIEITHDTPAVTEPEKGKKSKKSKKSTPQAPPSPVTFTTGTGILLNMNDAVKKDHLVTLLEHGDIELELEVMLPKGSNSGIYLQGRYEIQLLDSWGVKTAKYSDIGGIYRNWETEPGKIYSGKAPLSNAAKAPGLWQKMKIVFHAPRFDGSGKKISNAKFKSVILNGAEIHSNVEVPLPTGGPLVNNEVATGPLMIQGDHGPVAFRNIRYRLMNELDYKLSAVNYQVFHGDFKTTSDFANLKPVLSGTAPMLTSEVIDIENAYGVRYNGTITVPEDALYIFTIASTGGTKLIVNNKELFNYPTFDQWRSDTASIQLKAGTYPYEILNFKGASWMPPRLAFTVQTADSYPVKLHALNSYPPDDNPPSAIFIEVGKSPRLHRGFVDFNGNRAQRLTHTIGVGDPGGLHYIYDLKAGNLVCVWRGDFVNATPMWHDRGDGSFLPSGAPLFLFNNQPIGYIGSDTATFQTTGKEGEFNSKGYRIDDATGRPVFMYSYQGLEIEDHVYPEENNRVISHEVIIKTGTAKNGLTYKLAEGASIEPMPDGSFAVNDKQYYIKVGLGSKPVIREVDGKKELITPFSTPSIKYTLTW